MIGGIRPAPQSRKGKCSLSGAELGPPSLARSDERPKSPTSDLRESVSRQNTPSHRALHRKPRSTLTLLLCSLEVCVFTFAGNNNPPFLQQTILLCALPPGSTRLARHWQASTALCSGYLQRAPSHTEHCSYSQVAESLSAVPKYPLRPRPYFCSSAGASSAESPSSVAAQFLL